MNDDNEYSLEDNYKIETIKDVTGIRFKYFVYILEREVCANTPHRITLKHYKDLDRDEFYYLVEYHGCKMSILLEDYKGWKKKHPIEKVILG